MLTLLFSHGSVNLRWNGKANSTGGWPTFTFVEAVKKPPRKLIDRKIKRGKLWA
jgi:hypothetical protein